MKRVDGRERSAKGSLLITYCVFLVLLYRHISLPLKLPLEDSFFSFLSFFIFLVLCWCEECGGGKLFFYASYITFFLFLNCFNDSCACFIFACICACACLCLCLCFCS